MSKSKIEQMYKDKYDSEATTLKNNHNSTVAGYETQKNNANSNYNATQNTINKNKVNTQNQYKETYLGLDKEQAKGKKEYYNQRNQASYQNAKNVQAIRDYMASNLLSSGESVDAMLRNNTDFANSMGSIYSAESDFNTELLNRRNKYKADELVALQGYDNQLAEALATRNNLLTEMDKNIALANSSLKDNLLALEKQNNAEKIQAILNWELSNKASGGGYYGGSGGSGSYTAYDVSGADAKAAMGDLVNDFNQYIIDGDSRKARDLLYQALTAERFDLLPDGKYVEMQAALAKLEEEKYQEEAKKKRKEGHAAEYGFRNGVAGWYYF